MAEEVHQPTAELVIDQNSNRFLEGSSLLFSLSAIVAVLFCLFLVLYNYSLTRSTANYDKQRAAIMSQIETPDNQKLEKTINSATVTIASLKTIFSADTYKTSDLLTNFPKIIPKNTMLSNLSLDQDSNLKIDGQTDSMSTLATLIQSLHDSNYLDSITLIGVVTESSNNKIVTKFSISCILNKEKARAGLVATADATAAAAAAAAAAAETAPAASSDSSTSATSTTTAPTEAPTDSSSTDLTAGTAVTAPTP